jgi:hypothetical protein
LALIRDSVARYGAVVAAAWRPAPGRRLPSLRRIGIMAVFLPALTVVQATHAICLALDNLVFPGFRRVTVRAPLFVLGVPRSGTTLTHRTLAHDPALTTFTVWECLLAPSIVQRRLVQGLARLDRVIGRPGARLLGWLERRVFRALDDVHAMDLTAPEEDYLALLPAMACFILVVPFPAAQTLWRLAEVDRGALPAPQRDRLLAFYKGLLQRHLYVHGPDRRLLSKNAAFAGMAGSLRQAFPDALVLRCDREPESVVPSQLSSIQGGVALFDSDPDGTVFPARMPDVLRGYYEALDTALPRPGGPRHIVFDMTDLKTDLCGAIKRAYSHFGLPLDPAFVATLQREAEAARRYRSNHRYAARDFGLDGAGIASVVGPGHPARGGDGSQDGRPVHAAGQRGP